MSINERQKNSVTSAENGQEQKLGAEILADAQKKAERIRQRANKDQEKARERQQKELERLEQARLAQADTQANERVTSILSRIEHEKKRRAIIALERIVSTVLERVRSRFDSVADENAEAVLKAWFDEAFQAMGAERGQVMVSSATEALARQALASLPSGWVLESVESMKGLGLVLESDDRGRRFNNTLSARMERFMDALRLEVCESLDLQGVYRVVADSSEEVAVTLNP